LKKILKSAIEWEIQKITNIEPVNKSIIKYNEILINLLEPKIAELNTNKEALEKELHHNVDALTHLKLNETAFEVAGVEVENKIQEAKNRIIANENMQISLQNRVKYLKDESLLCTEKLATIYKGPIEDLAVFRAKLVWDDMDIKSTTFTQVFNIFDSIKPDWCYSFHPDLKSSIYVLYKTVAENCTETKCPKLNIGTETFQIKNKKGEVKATTAANFVETVFDWSHSHLESTDAINAQYLLHMLRIYGHIRSAHWESIIKYNEDKHFQLSIELMYKFFTKVKTEDAQLTKVEMEMMQELNAKSIDYLT